MDFFRLDYVYGEIGGKNGTIIYHHTSYCIFFVVWRGLVWYCWKIPSSQTLQRALESTTGFVRNKTRIEGFSSDISTMGHSTSDTCWPKGPLRPKDFTPRPVWPRGIVIACVCPSVCIFLLVHTIAFERTHLESPNLIYRCILVSYRMGLHMVTFDLDIQGHLGRKCQNWPKTGLYTQ